MFQNRGVRLIASALVIAGLVCFLLFFSKMAFASTGHTIVEPRNATPVEIAEAALEGQVEAIRKAGFDEDCLFVIGMYGKLCIEQCVSGDEVGFSLELYTDYPRCTVKSCTCEDSPEPSS